MLNVVSETCYKETKNAPREKKDQVKLQRKKQNRNHHTYITERIIDNTCVAFKDVVKPCTNEERKDQETRR